MALLIEGRKRWRGTKVQYAKQPECRPAHGTMSPSYIIIFSDKLISGLGKKALNDVVWETVKNGDLFTK